MNGTDKALLQRFNACTSTPPARPYCQIKSELLQLREDSIVTVLAL